MRNNIGIFGMKENAGNENAPDVRVRVLELFRDNQQLNINDDNINRCHRAGRKQNGTKGDKDRAIFVKVSCTLHV